MKGITRRISARANRAYRTYVDRRELVPVSQLGAAFEMKAVRADMVTILTLRDPENSRFLPVT